MVQCAASALCERNQAFLLVMFLIVVVTNALIFRSIRYGVETFTFGGGEWLPFYFLLTYL